METDRQKVEKTWEAAHRAIAAVNAGEPYDEVCAFCGGKLVVEALPPAPSTQWFIRCPCGKSNGIFKGL